MAEICNFLRFVVIAVIFINVTATDYCSLASCKQSHTMCLYTSPAPAAACGDHWSDNHLSDAEKKDILDKHNELRRYVASGAEKRGNPGPQPAAVSIPDLVWDNELEAIAQRWANQCNFSHDKCRNVDRFAVGQNIAITYSSGKITSTVKSMIQSWYNEVDKFNKNQVSSYTFDPSTGHYTQVIWAGTTKIGCGRIKYKGSNGWNTHYLVCNYGPSGNWIGQKIYEKK